MVTQSTPTSALLPPHVSPLSPSAAKLKHIFQTMTPEHCPTMANFHMHTLCSDGQLKPETLMQQAQDIGISNLAITDHHTINGYRCAQRWLQKRNTADTQTNQTQVTATKALPKLWVGLEVNAGLLDIEVHILCYAFDPDHRAMKPYLQGIAAIGNDYEAASVIQAVHQAGGLAVLAHPSRYRRSPAELIAAAAAMGIDGIETYYAYDNPEPWRPSPRQTKVVHQLGELHGLFHTCGTDTHGDSLLKRL